MDLETFYNNNVNLTYSFPAVLWRLILVIIIASGTAVVKTDTI